MRATRPSDARPPLVAAAALFCLTLPPAAAAALPGAPGMPCTAAVQDDGAPGEDGAGLPTPQQRLATDLANLERAAPTLDAETRARVPMFREMLRRAHLERETITESELRIVRRLREVIGTVRIKDPDPIAALQALKTEIQQAPGVSAKPVVTAAVRRAPGGRKIGVVTLAVADRKRTVAEIVAGAGGLTPGRRAEEVARRLRATHASDPLWWTRARVATVRNNYVVAAPTAPGGYVITADANFARERGIDRAGLAALLVGDIRSTYDRVVQFKSGGAGRTPQERRAAAADLRVRGDEAFDRGDLAGAERSYRGAVETDADYAVAYQRLADLYRSQKKTADARRVAESALARPGLDADARRELGNIAAGRSGP